MDFAASEHLVWLWALPLAVVLLGLREKRRRTRLAAFLGVRGVSELTAGRGRRRLQAALIVTALALVIVALARPRWGYDWQDVKRRGVDIVVAVDLSASMLASDVDPTRLERAKREIADLLGLLRGDRLGLVAFAGQAFVQCPLTEDYAAARMFMSYLDAKLIPSPGTNLGAAIQQSLRALKDGSPGETQGQAIIVITDGEDTYGDGLQAAKAAKEAGVRIYTVGVGSEAGAPIPEEGGGYKKDREGNLVLTKPDERGLQEIALATGGMFVRSVSGDMDLAEIYTKGIKRSLTEREYEETRRKLWRERFQWFLGAAFALLVIEMFLRQRGGLALAALALLIVMPEARATGSKAAHESFEKKDYGAAASAFGAEAVEHPDDARVLYNQAASLYRAGRYKEAAEAFERAAAGAKTAKDAELEARASFNRANALVGMSSLDDAIKAYEEILAAKPEDKAAAENLAYVKKLKEQQQKQQDKKDQQDESEKKDEQKENQPQPQDAPKKDDEKKDRQQEKEQDQQQGQEKQSDQQQESEQKGQGQEPQPEPGQGGEKKDESSPTGQGQGESQEQEPKEAKAPQPQQAQGKLGKEQAEQVLRGAQDQAGRYLLVPANERQKNVPPPDGKDW